MLLGGGTGVAAVVTTRAGRLEGVEQRDGLVFRGIPYAAPPRKKLRFRPPEAPLSWPGLRPAVRFGRAAPQDGPTVLLIRRLIGAAAGSQSQDCLYLNVWTPAADSRRRPVLVWLHGGAFIMGTGATALYNGEQLSQRGDVVVVTINYRLGALGFLNLCEFAPGCESVCANLGLRDQISALEWVRDNIDSFGGDPDCVTLFGESAGAMSVGTLLGTPRARGLFHRAILQSGAADNVSSREQASGTAEHFLEELGILDPNPEDLREARVSDIIRAQSVTSARLGMADGTLPWQPSLDGDLLPEPPLQTIARGRGPRVPVMLGTNRDEWKLFMLGDRSGRRLDDEGLRRRFERSLSRLVDAGAPALESAMEVYARDAVERPCASPAERWVAFQSDRLFHHPARRLADCHAGRGNPTYRYLFEWSPRSLGKQLGSCHGLEIPFVFGTLNHRRLKLLVAAAPAAHRLSERMQGAWIAFARTGNPCHDDLPDWPAHRPEKASIMRLGRTCFPGAEPFQDAMRFWECLR